MGKLFRTGCEKELKHLVGHGDFMSHPVHLRRCHLCGETCVGESGPVEKCSHCGKTFAPFYYFDDRYTVVLADDGVRSPLTEGEYSSIKGLSAFWEAF